ncbi:MAG TPA: LppX_LprAFG lipoprotein [Candidatus Dormibacteraeota bacterium]
MKRELLLLPLLLLAGCSGGGSSPPPDPAAELRQSAAAMSKVQTVSADVKFGAGLVYQGFTLDSASSKIKLPSASDTLIKVKQQDFLVDLEVITVDGHVYFKAPFSKFVEISPDEAAALPDLAALLDAQKGLPAVMAAGRAPKLEGTEKVGGVDCDRISTTYTADQVGQVLGGGLKPSGDIAATLWVGQSDHLLRRVKLSGPLVSSSSSSSADVTLHDFNAPLTITAPTPPA